MLFFKRLSQAFCFRLALRTGVVGTSVSGFTLMVMTLVHNLIESNYSPASKRLVQWLVLGIYLAVMFSAFICGFIGAFKGTLVHVNTAAILLLCGIVMYLIYSILSFIALSLMSVCLDYRCGPSHWLVRQSWRRQLLYDRDGRDPHMIRPITPPPWQYISPPPPTPGPQEKPIAPASFGHHRHRSEDKPSKAMGIAVGVISFILITCYFVAILITYVGFAKELYYLPPEPPMDPGTKFQI